MIQWKKELLYLLVGCWVIIIINFIGLLLLLKNMDQVYVATIPYLEPCPNWNRNGNFVHFFQEG